MILGRNPGLWLAVVAAALNVAVIVFGVPLSDFQVGALNVLAFTIVGLVSNASDPSTVPTFALRTRAPASAGSSGATASPSGTPATPTVATPSDPTSPSGGGTAGT